MGQEHHGHVLEVVAEEIVEGGVEEELVADLEDVGLEDDR